MQRRLERRRRVVADEADRAAGETRQAGNERRPELRHQPPQRRDERLVAFGGDARSSIDGLAAARSQHEERILAEERVARHAFAPLDALEQERVVGVFGDLQERRDRRQQVGDDLLDDRHERPAPGELHEFFEGRLLHELLCRAGRGAVAPALSPAAAS